MALPLQYRTDIASSNELEHAIKQAAASTIYSRALHKEQNIDQKPGSTGTGRAFIDSSSGYTWFSTIIRGAFKLHRGNLMCFRVLSACQSSYVASHCHLVCVCMCARLVLSPSSPSPLSPRLSLTRPRSLRSLGLAALGFPLVSAELN